MSPREGAALRLLTPSVLLPAQVVSPWADRWLRRLCRAILVDALACLDGKGPSSNMGSSDSARRASQAREWFQSDATYLFSFATVCAVLDLDVAAVRRQVRQREMKEQPNRYIGVRDRVKETTAAARETIARANAALDQTRQRLHELEESRQLHRAISDQIPTSTPQVSDALPEAVPLAEPPIKN